MTNILLFIFGYAMVEHFIKYALVEDFLKSTPPSTTDMLKKCPPSVLVMQPILSGDPLLEDCLIKNISSKSELDRHFLWLIDDTDLEAHRICHSIKAQAHEKRITIKSLPDAPLEVNPKMFKLQSGSTLFKEDFIAVLDDDTVLPDYGLDEVASMLSQNKGLAFGLPFYKNFSSFWSGFVSLFVNSSSLLTYIPYIRIISPITINGMFYVMSKESFSDINGFNDIEHQLCDDFAIAAKAKDYGLPLLQTPVTHGISTTVSSGLQCFRLLTRWMVFPQVSIMKQVTLKEKLIFLVIAALPKILPLALLLCVLFAPSPIGFLLLGISMCFQVLIVFKLNARHLQSVTPLSYLFSLPIQQLVLPFIIFNALLNSRFIRWRGKKMAINKDGTFSVLA